MGLNDGAGFYGIFVDFREGKKGWDVGGMVMEIGGDERGEVRGVVIEIVDGEGGK